MSESEASAAREKMKPASMGSWLGEEEESRGEELTEEEDEEWMLVDRPCQRELR